MTGSSGALAANPQVFSYTVRGHEGPTLSGSVPRQIFNAEPDSALAHMYNGDWRYTRDERGRALINSDPRHWPIIINWLSFGTVPDNPTSALISECKYWQLSRLLEALDCAQNVHVQNRPNIYQLHVSKTVSAGNVGFSATCHIYRFAVCFGEAIKPQQKVVMFDAAGRSWTLSFSQKDMHLIMTAGGGITCGLVNCAWGSHGNVIAFCNPKGSRWYFETSNKTGHGWDISKEAARLMHPRILEPDGSIQLKIAVEFCN